VALHPSQIVSVTPFLMSDDIGLPYSPALLFDAGFDASITDGSDFSLACQNGFYGFFEDMYEDDASGDGVFVGCSLTYLDVERVLVRNVVRHYNVLEKFYGFSPLSWRAGWALGWLSALALFNRPLALQGIDLLSVLVPSCQKKEMGRAA
jgi:hypothetical protein